MKNVTGLVVLALLVVGSVAVAWGMARQGGAAGGAEKSVDRSVAAVVEQAPPVAPTRSDPGTSEQQAARSDGKLKAAESSGDDSPAPLSSDVQRQVRIVESTCGLEAGRVARLAREKPDAYREIVKAFESVAVEIGSAKEDLQRRQVAVNEARIASGNFEVVTQPNQPRPGPSVPGEIVHTSIVFDRQLGIDVRRVVRIRPGEDPKLDELSARLSAATADANRVMTQLMTSYGY